MGLGNGRGQRGREDEGNWRDECVSVYEKEKVCVCLYMREREGMECVHVYER